MKKIITTLLVLSGVAVNAQVSIVEAPVLEQMTADVIAIQAQSKADGYQTQLNTLQTAKNSLSTMEQIEKWNKRVQEVNSYLKQFNDVVEIVQLSKNMYTEAEGIVNFIQNNPINDKNGNLVGDKAINQINRSLTSISSIVSMLNSFTSSNMEMNDFERKTLIDKYKKEAYGYASRIRGVRQKYETVLAFNSF